MPASCPVRWAGQSVIITLPAEIDINNAGQVSNDLFWVLDQGSALLVVDMTGTTFCASAGVHALLAARKQAAAISVMLRLAACGYALRRVLELTGADQLIDIYPSLDAALAGTPGRRDGQVGPVCGDGRVQAAGLATGEPCPGSAAG